MSCETLRESGVLVYIFGFSFFARASSLVGATAVLVPLTYRYLTECRPVCPRVVWLPARVPAFWSPTALPARREESNAACRQQGARTAACRPPGAGRHITMRVAGRHPPNRKPEPPPAPPPRNTEDITETLGGTAPLDNAPSANAPPAKAPAHEELGWPSKMFEGSLQKNEKH